MTTSRHFRARSALHALVHPATAIATGMALSSIIWTVASQPAGPIWVLYLFAVLCLTTPLAFALVHYCVGPWSVPVDIEGARVELRLVRERDHDPQMRQVILDALESWAAVPEHRADVFEAIDGWSIVTTPDPLVDVTEHQAHGQTWHDRKQIRIHGEPTIKQRQNTLSTEVHHVCWWAELRSRVGAERARWLDTTGNPFTEPREVFEHKRALYRIDKGLT